MPRFFAMASRGLIDVLADELKAMGMDRVLKAPGGCHFDSNWAGCYRANLRSRTASRIILPILDFPAYNPEELYNNIRKHDFTKYIDPDGTMTVDANVKECGEFRDQRFVAMKVKDAVVDQFREKFDVRPNVDNDDPDLRLVVRGFKNQFNVSIDTTGDALFKRGYRIQQVDAPLKETVAAGIIKMAGYEANMPVVDPMCGSGTILIEAALMALKVSPGTMRKSFAFQKFKGFKEDEWEKELDACIEEEIEEIPFKFYGYDLSGEAIKAAKANIKKAGLEDYIEVQRTAFETIDAPVEKGVLITNPPYGERLLEKNEAIEVFKNLAFLLKTKFKGWDAYVLSGDPELSSGMRLKADRKFPVYNGKIECRLLKYQIR